MKPFEHYHHHEVRLNEIRDEQWQIERDRRRERECRKTEFVTGLALVAIILSVLTIIAATFVLGATPVSAESVAETELLTTSVILDDAAPVKTEEPEDFENEKIEEALVEQGYFRSDVPLDYEVQADLRAACDEFGVEFELMLALIERETNFRNVVGDSGESIGYCQIQPKWWQGLMEEIGAKDLMTARDNFRTSCAIITHYINQYGTVERALTAYNSGSPGSSEYADAVLAGAEKWKTDR